MDMKAPIRTFTVTGADLVAEDGSGQCYLEGYEKGASDVVRKMEESAGRLRSNLILK